MAGLASTHSSPGFPAPEWYQAFRQPRASDGTGAWQQPHADWENHRFSIWTRSDAASTSWSNQTTFGSDGTGPSNLTNPQGVFMAADGLTIWVSDSGNSRISIWTRPDATSANWANQTTFGSFGTGPTNLKLADGVWASSDGLSAWVADTGNHRVSIWTRASATSTTWDHLDNLGSYGSTTSEFAQPRSVVVASDGLTAWIGDYSNNRVSIWTQS
jgi:sugar lactone lactonase YvrE